MRSVSWDRRLIRVFTLQQLLPDNGIVDPMELLSYLDPPDLNTPPSSGSSNNANSDDILAALFD